LGFGQRHRAFMRLGGRLDQGVFHVSPSRG
jgi:hypothetical protein